MTYTDTSNRPPLRDSRARTWVLGMLATTIVVAALVAGVNRAINRYGVFGDVHGRALSPVQNERMTKYLFAQNYIPANFDGLLVGSSTTDSWATERIHSARVYNASIAGGNATEETLVAAGVFAHRRMKLTIIAIHPYITETHGRKSGYMRPREYWSALGSVQLLQTYIGDFLVRSGRHRKEYSPFGRFDERGTVALPAPPPTGAVTPPNVVIDSVALREFRELIAAAHASSDRVVGVVPPNADLRGQRFVADYAEYAKKIKALFSPADTIIDFNEPAYAAFRANDANFTDGIHVTPAAAAELSDLFAKRVDQTSTVSAVNAAPR